MAQCNLCGGYPSNDAMVLIASTCTCLENFGRLKAVCSAIVALAYDGEQAAELAASSELRRIVDAALEALYLPLRQQQASDCVQKAYQYLIAMDDSGLREWLNHSKERDLIRALHDPAWEPLRVVCLANMPRGRMRRFEDEWSWMEFNQDISTRAQIQVARTFVQLVEKGHLSYEPL